jgi:hypothetical protein
MISTRRPKKYFCTAEGCKYAKKGGRGFPREGNWRRHLRGRCGALEREGAGEKGSEGDAI